MNEIAKAILALGKDNSRTYKENLLNSYKDNEGVKAVLRFIFNPYIRTGIAAAKLRKALGSTSERPTMSVYEVLDYFTKHQTGSDNDVFIAQAFIDQQETDEARELAIAIVTKNLKVGVSVTTLNKVYGKDFIPKIGIMRGERYMDVKDKVKGPFIVTEKLDGARRLIVKDNGKITLYSRNGHVDEGLVEIEEEAKALPDNSVYDAELLALGDFKDSVELRQATNAIANSKGPRKGLTANIFDMVPLDDFKRGISEHDAISRKTLIAAMFRDTASLKQLGVYDPVEYCDTFGIKGATFRVIRPVPVLGIAYSEEEILDMAQPLWDSGKEGLMLNTLSGKYEISSSPRRQLLKVKATEEYVLECIGVFEGEGRLKGTMGGIVLNYRGHEVRCGSGFNDAQRAYYWKRPESIVGKQVEIDSFGESTNKAGGISLNCPIFKRVVGSSE